MKFFIKDFFSKRDQIRNFLRIWSHLLKKSLMETSLFVQWTLFPVETIVRNCHYCKPPIHHEHDLKLRRTWIQILLNEDVQMSMLMFRRHVAGRSKQQIWNLKHAWEAKDQDHRKICVFCHLKRGFMDEL